MLLIVCTRLTNGLSCHMEVSSRGEIGETSPLTPIPSQSGSTSTMEVATDKSGGEGKGDVAVIVNPSDPAHNEALNSTQSAPAKRLMNRNRAKRPNASAALSSEPRAAAGGARKKGKAAVGKRKRIVESDDDDDDDYDATAAANNNEEEEKERAGKQEVTVKMGNVKLQFRGKVIQAKLPNEQQGVGLVSASAGSASEIQKDSSVANEPAPELQEIAGVGTSSRIIMPGDQKRPQQSPASSDTANKTQDLLANVPIQDNAAKPRSSLTNSAMKGKLAAKKDLTKRSATTSSNISASAVPASVTPTPITTSPVIPTSASVPAPVKKPKRPLPSSKVTSNPKPSTEVAAAPAPVISAEPSFLDSLFSGTIPQTEHEKQLQKEREEKAAKARTETLQSQLDEDKELSHKRVAILKSRAAVKVSVLVTIATTEYTRFRMLKHETCISLCSKTFCQ